MRPNLLASCFLAACLLAGAAAPAQSASVHKTYSYYTIGGKTLDELQEQLMTRGPKVASTGRNHPGATQMEFTTRVGYTEGERNCRIANAAVRLEAKVILPKWRRTSGAGRDVRLVWNTLSADIKRHEESHVIIAKNHARELEQALLGISPQRSCALAAQKVEETSRRILRKHDEAQSRFDRIELSGFERRFLRLMEYRMQRIEDGLLEE